MHGLYATDPCSHRGAEKLAKQIRTYWLDRGKHVEVWTEKYLDSVYMVKSNLKGGVPAKAFSAPPEHSPWKF